MKSPAAYCLQELSELAEEAVSEASLWLRRRKGPGRLKREGMSGATAAAATFLTRMVARLRESAGFPAQGSACEPRPANQPWSPVARSFFTRYLGADELAWQHAPVDPRRLRAVAICRCEDYAEAGGDLAGWPGDYADGLEPTQLGTARVRDRAAACAQRLAQEHGEAASLREVARALHAPDADPVFFGHACVRTYAAASHLAFLTARAKIVLRVLADRKTLTSTSWCSAYTALTKCALYAAYARHHHAIDTPANLNAPASPQEQAAASEWLAGQLAHALSPAGAGAVQEVWDVVTLPAAARGASTRQGAHTR